MPLKASCGVRTGGRATLFDILVAQTPRAAPQAVRHPSRPSNWALRDAQALHRALQAALLAVQALRLAVQAALLREQVVVASVTGAPLSGA